VKTKHLTIIDFDLFPKSRLDFLKIQNLAKLENRDQNK